MRRFLPYALAVALVALPLAPAALAQDAAPRDTGPDWPAGVESWHSGEDAPRNGNPQEAEQRGLTSPEVEDSQMPEPTRQGTRSPEPTGSAQADLALYEALSLVRRAPPGLDGRPTPRPNAYASEPETEMEPSPTGNPEHLFPENYIE
ncbi:hypothetical protein [Azospirillum halopraeferens]|uniref:hypothetical protein n=1 Tax=Azospirillum halopraeferens TaxID=34010 RepID=UPI0004043BF9|nr:hypothetical protein [Azospirillum halopraeferens]